MKQSENRLPQEMEALEIEGTIYPTFFTKKYASKPPFRFPDEKKILSYLPGTVLEVKVKVGDRVVEGQEILAFEAMKMRNTIQSPASGVIASIAVEPGSVFAKGFVLFELE